MGPCVVISRVISLKWIEMVQESESEYKWVINSEFHPWPLEGSQDYYFEIITVEIMVFVREFVNRQDLNPPSVPNSPKMFFVVVFFFKAYFRYLVPLSEKAQKKPEWAGFFYSCFDKVSNLGKICTTVQGNYIPFSVYQ